MADQNQEQAIKQYMSTLKPDDNAEGLTTLPNGEVVEVKKDEPGFFSWDDSKGFWGNVKDKASMAWEGIAGIGNYIDNTVSGRWGDLNTSDNIFENATYNGSKISGEQNDIKKNYYTNLKTVTDFEKNGLTNSNDILNYNLARQELNKYQFAKEEDKKTLKSLMTDDNIIDTYGLGWDEQGNAKEPEGPYRIIRHGALKEEINNASTDSYLDNIKTKIAQQMVDDGYQANMNPGGRASTLDEVRSDLDNVFSTIGTLGTRLQAYKDAINITEGRDTELNHEFKRLSEGLYDMVSYILKDDSGKSSEQLMREYIQTKGDPMQINGDKLSGDAYAVFKNAQIGGVGMADAYQMANILKNVYELEDSATKFADGGVGDKVLYGLKLAWDAVGLAGSEAGLLANTVFHKLPALAKYTLTTDVLFNQVGYKDGQGYNMKDFASYVYGFQDSGISRLKTRTQLKYGDSDMDNQWGPDALRDLWSGVDDVVAAIVGTKGLSLATKAPALAKAGVRLTEAAKTVTTASNAVNKATKVVKAVTEGEKVSKIVDKSKGIAKFVNSVGTTFVEGAKSLTVTPIKNFGTAIKEFRILGGAGMNIQKAKYLGEAVMKWAGEEALQSAYFNGLTSMPYTEADMWADIGGSIFGAWDRASQFTNSFIKLTNTPNTTKRAAFGMKEILGMSDHDIEKVLKKSTTQSQQLAEFGQAVLDNVKPYIEKSGVASSKHVASASENLSKNVRKGLEQKIDKMVLDHDQTFMKKLAESSDIRHHEAVKQTTDKNGNVRYEWSKKFNENNATGFQKKKIEKRKEQAHKDIFEPKTDKKIDRIMQLKKIVSDNLALYCSTVKQFKDDVKKVNGRWQFKNGISDNKKKLYFAYVLGTLLKKEGLDRTAMLKEAIAHEKKSMFGEARLGKEALTGETTEAGMFSMKTNKFANFSDRINYFINSRIIGKEQLAQNYIMQLMSLGAWVGKGYMWWYKKYKGGNPLNQSVKELEKSLKEFGRLRDESIKLEFMEEGLVDNVVDIKNSVANMTYRDACKANPNLIDLGVERFTEVVWSEQLSSQGKHEFLTNYKKHDKNYKEFILDLKKEKPSLKTTKKNTVFGSLNEEYLTLGVSGTITVPKKGYKKENGNVIMDTSKDNSDTYTYYRRDELRESKQKEYYYEVTKVVPKVGAKTETVTVGIIHTVPGKNNGERVMWFEPVGNELKDGDLSFMYKKTKDSRLLSDDANAVKTKIEIDEDTFKRKPEQKQEDKPAEIPQMTEKDWINLMNLLNSNLNITWRTFVDSVHPKVAQKLGKDLYRKLVTDKNLTAIDRFKIIADIVNCTEKNSYDLDKGFCGNFKNDISKQFIYDSIDSVSVADIKIKRFSEPITCIMIKGVDGDFAIIDFNTREVVGRIPNYSSKGITEVIINGERKEAKAITFSDKHLSKKTQDALMKNKKLSPEEIKKSMTETEEKVYQTRREDADYAKKFLGALGVDSKKIEDLIQDIYDSGLTKEEIVYKILNNYNPATSFDERAINTFKRFMQDSYSEPEVLGRKLKYEWTLAQECKLYKQTHNLNLEDVELHECLRRYDQIKENDFVLNAAEREIADLIYGASRKSFSRDEFINVIAYNYFNKLQPSKKIKEQDRLLSARRDRLIQFLTKDSDSKNWSEDTKRTFIDHIKEYVDITTHSVEEVANDVRTYPEDYYDLLKQMQDDFKAKEKEFDITSDEKIRNELEEKLEKAQKEYEKLKKKSQLKTKPGDRKRRIEQDYYTNKIKQYDTERKMIDDDIAEKTKYIKEFANVERYNIRAELQPMIGINSRAFNMLSSYDGINPSSLIATILKENKNNTDLPKIERLLQQWRDANFVRYYGGHIGLVESGFLFDSKDYNGALREGVITKIRNYIKQNGGDVKVVDDLIEDLKQKDRILKLKENATAQQTNNNNALFKQILENTTQDDLDKTMLETLIGKGIGHNLILSEKEFRSALNQIKNNLKNRSFVIVGRNGIESHNLTKQELYSIGSVIEEKATKIYDGSIGGSNIVKQAGTSINAMLYGTNQNIVGIGHEWFHNVVHGVYKDSEIERFEEVFDLAYNKYKGVIIANAESQPWYQTLQGQIEKIKRLQNNKYGDKQIKEIEARIKQQATEEWLADRFGEYVAGKLQIESSEILAFFQELWLRIQAFLDPKVLNLFDDIYNNRISNVRTTPGGYRVDVQTIGARQKTGKDSAEENLGGWFSLDMNIGRDNAKYYAENPVKLSDGTSIEDLKDLMQNRHFNEIFLSLQGTGLGRLPSVMGVNGKSYMTEMSKIVDKKNAFEKELYDIYSSNVFDQSVLSHVWYNFTNSGLGTYTETLDNGNGKVLLSFQKTRGYVRVIASIETPDGRSVRLYKKEITERTLQNTLINDLYLDGRFNVNMKKRITSSFVELNKPELDKSVLDITKNVVKSVKQNCPLYKNKEWNLPKEKVEAINEMYRLTIFNRQIPKKSYVPYADGTDFVNGNPIGDWYDSDLDLLMSEPMYIVKVNNILDMSEKYKDVPGITVSKYIDVDQRGVRLAVVNFEIETEVGLPNISFNFHLGVYEKIDPQIKIRYDSIPDNVRDIKAVTWNQYPLSLSKDDFVSSLSREGTQISVGISLYDKFASNALVNTFTNAIVLNDKGDLNLIGKTRFKKEIELGDKKKTIDAVALYSNKRPRDFDGEGLIYYVDTKEDGIDLYSYLISKNKDVEAFGISDVHGDYVSFINSLNYPEYFKNKILVIYGNGTSNYGLLDSKYISDSIKEANELIQYKKWMTSADASVINDLSSDKRLSNELDEINDSLDKTITSRSELERVRSKLINYRKELNKLENRKSLLKNKSKDTTESKREKLKQLQQEYNYFIGFDIKKASDLRKQILKLEDELNVQESVWTPQKLTQEEIEKIDLFGIDDKQIKRKQMLDLYFNLDFADFDSERLENFVNCFNDVEKIIESRPNKFEFTDDAREVYDKVLETIHDKNLEEGEMIYLLDSFTEPEKKLIKNILYKTADSLKTEQDINDFIPAEIAKKIEYDDNGKQALLREADKERLVDYYRDNNAYTDYDNIPTEELNEIYEGVKNNNEVAKTQLFTLLRTKVAEIAIDYMKDKLDTSVSIMDMISEAEDELRNIINRLPTSKNKKGLFIDQFISGGEDLFNRLDGEGAIRGGTDKVNGITSRLKAKIDSYMGMDHNKETIRFIKEINSIVDALVQSAKFNSEEINYDLVERAFELWREKKIREQKRFTGNEAKQIENVNAQLRKVFPIEDYPEVNIDAVRSVLGESHLSLDRKFKEDGTTTLGDTIADESNFAGQKLEEIYKEEELKEKAESLMKKKEEVEEKIKESLPNDVLKKLEKSKTLDGYVENLQKEEVYNFYLQKERKSLVDTKKIAWAKHFTDNPEGAISKKENILDTIRNGRTGLIEKYGTDISDNFGLKDFEKLGFDVVSAEGLVGEFDYWLGNLPLNMKTKHVLKKDFKVYEYDEDSKTNVLVRTQRLDGDINLSYTDCIEKLRPLRNTSGSEEMIEFYENAAVESVWFNIMNTKTFIPDVLKQQLNNKEIDSATKIYNLYLIKNYIDSRLGEDAGVYNKLNQKFLEERSKVDSAYLKPRDDGMVITKAFKDIADPILATWGYSPLPTKITFGEMRQRNPLSLSQYKNQKSLVRQIKDYHAYGSVIDLINPSTTKSGYKTLFVKGIDIISDLNNADDSIGKILYREKDIEAYKSQQKELGNVVVEVRMKGVVDESIDPKSKMGWKNQKYNIEVSNEDIQKVITRVPYDRIRFAFIAEGGNVDKIYCMDFGGKKVYLNGFDYYKNKASDFEHTDSHGLLDTYKKNVNKEKAKKTKEKKIEKEYEASLETKDLKQKVQSMDSRDVKDAIQRLKQQIDVEYRTMDNFRNQLEQFIDPKDEIALQEYRNNLKENTSEMSKLWNNSWKYPNKYTWQDIGVGSKEENELRRKALKEFGLKNLEKDSIPKFDINLYPEDYGPFHIMYNSEEILDRPNVPGAMNDYKGNIHLDTEKIDEIREKKLWRNPMRSEPLGYDFKTKEELYQFILLHEIAHEYIVSLEHIRNPKNAEAVRELETAVNNEVLRLMKVKPNFNFDKRIEALQGYEKEFNDLLKKQEGRKKDNLQFGNIYNRYVDVKNDHEKHLDELKEYDNLLRQLSEEESMEEIEGGLRKQSIDDIIDDISLDKSIDNETTKRQLIKQDIDNELSKYNNISFDDISLPDLSKVINPVLDNYISNNINGKIQIGLTPRDYRNTNISYNEYRSKYGIKDTSEFTKSKKDLKKVSVTQEDIAKQSHVVEDLKSQLDSTNKNIQDKIIKKIAYDNSGAPQNKAKIDELIKIAKKNSKNKIEITGQEGDTNKIIKVKANKVKQEVIQPVGIVLDNLISKDFDTKILQSKKATSTLDVEEKQLQKKYGDFFVYPYTMNDVDFISKLNALKDTGNFALMSGDPYQILVGKYKIMNKYPELELVYERSDGTVAYFINKKLDKESQQELAELRDDAQSVGSSTSSLSSYCPINGNNI